MRTVSFYIGALFGIAFTVAFSTWALTSKADACRAESEYGFCLVTVDWSQMPRMPLVFSPALSQEETK